MHRVPLAQREYLVVRVVGKTPRPAETTTRHCQPGGEGHTFGADSESEFLGLQLWASTPVASPAALRHHPRQEPRALTRMRGSVRGDWRKPVPYRDGAGHAKSPKKEVRSNPRFRKYNLVNGLFSRLPCGACSVQLEDDVDAKFRRKDSFGREFRTGPKL